MNLNYKPKAAFNILISDGFVYMVQELDKTWGFPGGGVEKGEMSIDAARREIEEETDSFVTVRNFEIQEVLDISNNKNFRVVAFVYDEPCYKNIIQCHPKLRNGETLQCKWVSFDDFLHIKLRQPLKKWKHKLHKYFYQKSF